MSKHIPDIKIYPIPHKSQKYNTAGNYGENNIKTMRDETWFEISEMKDWRYEALVTVHEMVEYFLCKHRKIKVKDIDKFDMETVFKVDPKNANDPGLSKYACYHKEHMFSTKIERLLCKEFGIDWNVYDKSFESLKYKK